LPFGDAVLPEAAKIHDPRTEITISSPCTGMPREVEKDSEVGGLQVITHLQLHFKALS
jgi:hypothetical protein